MSFSEKKGDLFSSDIKQLAHCVSADFEMGAGIAKEFSKRYNNVEHLLSQSVPVGSVGILYNDDLSLYYLVTKERYFHKPIMKSLQSSLETLRYILLYSKQYELAIPVIGCGLDKLVWNNVREMIKQILVDSGISVTVYKL